MKPTNAGSIGRTGAAAPANREKGVKDYLKVYGGEIAKALPSQIGAERFQRICMTALTQNATLAKCTPQSFIGAVLNAAQLGLEPNTPLGQAYLIPYGNQCTFQLGYRGMIELARRSGQIALIKAHEVYENDEFEYELGLDPKLRHVPAKGDRGKVVCYYAFYKTKDGDFDFEVASKREMEAHKTKYSKARNSPWVTDFDSMAKKTLIKRVLKYAPVSTEIARQIQTDESVKSFDPHAGDDLMKDLTLAPNEIIDAEFEVSEVKEDPGIDPVTGEVNVSEK